MFQARFQIRMKRGRPPEATWSESFEKPFAKKAPTDWKFSAQYFKRIANASTENCNQDITFHVDKLAEPPCELPFEKWLDSEILQNYIR